MTTTSIVWSGALTANTWTTAFNAASGRLASGTYIFSIAPFDTYLVGGTLYREGIVSAPFAWDTFYTNNAGACNAIETHMSGHASNGEALGFRTCRTAQPNFLVLQFMSNRAWSSNELEFTFLRLL